MTNEINSATDVNVNQTTEIKKGSINLNFLWKYRLKLRAEGNKLRAEGNKLWAEGNKLWAEGILECYGNIKIEWKNWNKEHQDYECHLENGEVFGFDEKGEK